MNLPFSTSITITIILNGVGAPARVIPPFFADRYGQLNTLVPILTCLAIVSFTWLAVSTTPGLYTFTVFYGVASAAFQCLIPSTVASITTEMNQFGTRLGMAFGSLSFAALTGPSLGGALQQAMGGKFLGAQLWAAVCCAVCVGLVACARVKKVGWKVRGVKA